MFPNILNYPHPSITNNLEHHIMALSKKLLSPPQIQEETRGFRSNIEGRVGRLEGAVENLIPEVQETSRAVRDVVSVLGKFKEDVLGHIGEATAPKWPLIISFIMIALTIITLAATLVSQNISGQSAAIAKISNRLDDGDRRDLEQAKLDGRHEEWRSRIDMVVKELDDKLQREMRLINDTTDSKIQANDKATFAKLTELQAQMVSVREWRLSHVQEDAKAHASAEVQLKNLSNAMDRLEDRSYRAGKSVSQLDYLRPANK